MVTTDEMLDFFNAVAKALNAYYNAGGRISAKETVDTIERRAQTLVANPKSRSLPLPQDRE